MAFEKVCTLDDLWEGDIAGFDVGGTPVLLAYPRDGEIAAFQGLCPHQAVALADGEFDGQVLRCRAHNWSFDLRTGAGVNPKRYCLARYPVKIEDDAVHVDVEGVTPVQAKL